MMDPTQLEKLAEGREAEIFAWESGRVLRLLRDPAATRRNEDQAEAMKRVRAAGGPAPEVYGTITYAGRPGLIMQRAEGASLLAVMASKPWRVWTTGSELAGLHADIHGIVAPDQLTSVSEYLAERFTSPLVPDDLRAAASRVLPELAPGNRLLHGDFHPDNVLLHRGNRLVIDWSNLSRGDPQADLARTWVLTRFAVLPDAAPVLLKVLDKVGRGLFSRSYESSYRRRIAVDEEVLEKWKFVNVVARLAEAVVGESDSLPRWARAHALYKGS